MSEQELLQIVSRNIKVFIDKRGLSQVDIANYVGVSEAAVSNWCNGRKALTLKNLDKLCEILRCSRSALMSEDGLSMLEAEDRQAVLSSLNDSELEMLDNYRQLNGEGQDQAMKHMKYLLSQPEYIKSGQSGLVQKEA